MVEIPKEVEAFGLDVNKKPEAVEKTVYNNLLIMKEQAIKMMDCYDRFCQCEDLRIRDDLVEAMSSRLNHISQAFRDIMAFIEINERNKTYEETLRYYVRQYFTKEICKTTTEKEAVEFLTKRNDLVHDYFNLNQVNHELVKGLENFGEGFVEMAENLEVYCISNFPVLALEKNLKKQLVTIQRKIENIPDSNNTKDNQ